MFGDSGEFYFGDDVVIVLEGEEVFVDGGDAEKFAVEFVGDGVQHQGDDQSHLLLVPFLDFSVAHGLEVVQELMRMGGVFVFGFLIRRNKRLVVFHHKGEEVLEAFFVLLQFGFDGVVLFLQRLGFCLQLVVLFFHRL